MTEKTLEWTLKNVVRTKCAYNNRIQNQQSPRLDFPFYYRKGYMTLLELLVFDVGYFNMPTQIWMQDLNQQPSNFNVTL